MVNQCPFKSHRMQGLPLKEDLPSLLASPHDPSNKGTIKNPIDSKVGSVSPLDHLLEGVVETLEEGSLPLENPPLTNHIGPMPIELPSST